MMSSQTQNALDQLFKMVNHMPNPSSTSTTSGHQMQQQMNRKPIQQLPPQQILRPPVYPQQNGIAFKPQKPLEKKTATAKPQRLPGQLNGLPNGFPTNLTNSQFNALTNAQLNGQLMDPRLLFPAALQMNGIPKMPPTVAPNLLQMPQMFPSNLPVSGAQLPFQMTPEMLTMMQMQGWGIDPTAAMMQQYLNLVQQQQQQYLQSLVLQSAQNNANCIKINESPKVTPPSSNPPVMPGTAANLDPLANLHNMVYAKVNTSPVESKPPMPLLVKKEEPVAVRPRTETVDEEEEIIVDVETADQKPVIQDQKPIVTVQEQEKTTRNTPPSSAPPKIAGPSFSIAEILHSNSSQSQPIDEIATTSTRTLTPVSVLPCLRQSSAEALSSQTELVIATDSQQTTDTPAPQSQSPSGRKFSETPKKERSAQRHRHLVDFHRRLKTITGRGKFCQCQICGDVVDSNTTELTNHIYHHSKTPLFGCVKCDCTFKQKAELHNHSKLLHSSDSVAEHDQHNDLRDMGKLCNLLEKCFPRNSKIVIETLLNKLLKSCKGSEALRCKLCDKDVPANVTSLKKHLEQHPRYRCKLCHYTNENECDQIKHGQEQHGSDSPIYNVTAAAIVLSGTLNACFGDYMPVEQQEFCEEMASIASDSPQRSPQQNGK